MAKMIIDFSILAHKNWHKMFSDSYEARPDSDELTEWVQNVTEEVLFLFAKFEPTETVFALDPPTNWRSGVVADYYHNTIDFYMDNTNNEKWFCVVDGLTYPITYSEMKKGWTKGKKLPSKAAIETPLDDAQLYTKYVGGKTPLSVVEAFPDVPLTVRDFGNWDGLQLAVPYYKGTRSNAVWKAKTTKEEFKKATKNLGERLAHCFNSHAVCVENLEADDLVGAYIKKNHDQEVVLVSNDSDLAQCHIWNKNLLIWNPLKQELEPSTSVDQTWFKLLCKVLGGDTADNIKGVMPTDKKAVLPVVKFDKFGNVAGGKGTVKLLEDTIETCGDLHDWESNIVPALKKTCDDRGQFSKNYTIVYLGNTPEDLITKTHEAFDGPWNTFGNRDQPVLSDFGLSEADILSVTTKATLDEEE